MENGLILDSQLSASSERFHHFSGAASARLNSQTVLDGKYGGWVATEDDYDLWFQINFISNTTVTAIVTQGLDIGINYVKEYTVAFGSSEREIQDYAGLNSGVATVRYYACTHILNLKTFHCI